MNIIYYFCKRTIFYTMEHNIMKGVRFILNVINKYSVLLFMKIKNILSTCIDFRFIFSLANNSIIFDRKNSSYFTIRNQIIALKFVQYFFDVVKHKYIM